MSTNKNTLNTTLFVTVVLLFNFIVISSPASAAIVEGLYEAEIVVANQSGDERKKAMKEAMRDVLTKVSSRPDVSTIPDIASALDNPSAYIQQYRYRKIPNNAIFAFDVAAGSQFVWFRFDERAINKLLQKNALPVWGKTRPATLVWLAVQQDGANFLVGSNAQEELRLKLELEAKKRGMALILPLLDLDDQNKISFADVWNNFQDPIFNASARYNAESILIGQLTVNSDDSWQGRWILYEGGQGLSWNGQGALAMDVLDAGIMGTVEILGSRYAQVYSNNTPGTFDIAIVNVNSLDQYAKVSQYLMSLDQVSGVVPVHINVDSVTFRLDVRGNSQGLIQTIGLGNTLQPVSPGTNTMQPGDPLNPGMPPAEIQVQENIATTAHVYRLRQ